MEFVPYPKTPRLHRDIVITEKLDGTNAQVVIKRGHDFDESSLPLMIVDNGNGLCMFAGSRSRWITPGKTTDNYGFAQWCLENADELFKLGEGQHFGEWYGQGIQRGYGLDHRRFSLFNTARWGQHNPNTPACCETVPVLYTGHMTDVHKYLEELKLAGSRAVPGFKNPEGVIVYHSASKQNFKVLIENDHQRKGV